MNRIIKECIYFERINFIRVKGILPNENYTKGAVYVDGKPQGEIKTNLYIIDIEKKTADQTIDWIFTKVLPCNKYSLVEIKFFDAQDNPINSVTSKISIESTIPKEFISTIGTKNSLIINQESHEEERFIEKHKKLDFKPPITLLHIESSSECNLRCKYCLLSNNYNAVERGIITNEVLDKAIDTINEMKTVKNVQFSGLGEPLMNPRFLEMCKRVYNETYVRNVQFFTNGMLFTEKISDELAEIPLNFKITFSIDGHEVEENNLYRCGSNYDTIKNNINYFLRRINKKQNFWIRIHNLQINKLSDINITVPQFLLNDFGHIQIDSHRAFNFPDLIEEKLSENNIAIYADKNKKICKRTFSEATIRSNGDIIRCHWDSACQIIMGNIIENKFSDIWFGDKYIQHRKIMLPDTEFEELPEVCKKCHAMNNGFLYKK